MTPHGLVALALSLLLLVVAPAQAQDIPLCTAAVVGTERVLRLPVAEVEAEVRRWRIAQWRVRRLTVRGTVWRVVVVCVAKEG